MLPVDPEPITININIHNNKEFRDLFSKLEPSSNLENFQCPKINQKLINEYSLVLISKINTDRLFTRVVVDICEKIQAKNRDFISAIASVSKKLYSLLLTNKKPILGFLEFFSLLNKKCECKESINLIKFAIFEAFDKDWIEKYDVSDENYGTMLLFLSLNKKYIEKMPLYVAGDIYYQMELINQPEYAKFNPKYEDQLAQGELANPSLKFAFNNIILTQNEDFESFFDDIRDLRVLNPKCCATFFMANAGREIEDVKPHLPQIFFSKLLKFMIKSFPNDKNVKIFRERILDHLKVNFMYHHIIKRLDGVSSYIIRGTAALVTELYRQEVMDFSDFKIFLKTMVDRFMTDENPVTEACNVSIFTKGYMRKFVKHQSDVNLSRFIQSSIGTNASARKRKYKEGLKDEKKKSDAGSGESSKAKKDEK